MRNHSYNPITKKCACGVVTGHRTRKIEGKRSISPTAYLVDGEWTFKRPDCTRDAILNSPNKTGKYNHVYEEDGKTCKFCNVKRRRIMGEWSYSTNGFEWTFVRPNCLRAIAFTAI